MGEKLFVSAEQLYRDSFELAHRVFASGYVPDVLTAIWRGGTPVGAIVHEYLEFKGIKTQHFPIKTSSYNPEGQRGRVEVEGIEPLVRALTADSKLLVIDDIFDSGLSLDAAINSLSVNGSTPAEIRIATLFYKPANNQTSRTPDFFVHETGRWVVLPHELFDLTIAELARERGGIFNENRQRD